MSYPPLDWMRSEWGRFVRMHRDRIEYQIRALHGRPVGVCTFTLLGVSGNAELLAHAHVHAIGYLARTQWSDPVV